MLEGNFGKFADWEFERARGKHRGNKRKHFMHVALSYLVLSEFVNIILHYTLLRWGLFTRSRSTELLKGFFHDRHF
jgi:hypothetical protein